jgi:Fe-S cluster assembly iron-binding protein IscA
LGLALDESENTNDFLLKEDDINIILDKNIKLMLDNGKPITIDYHESRYGSGFTIDSGFSC